MHPNDPNFHESMTAARYAPNFTSQSFILLFPSSNSFAYKEGITFVCPIGAIHTQVTTQKVKLRCSFWNTDPPTITSSVVPWVWKKYTCRYSITSKGFLFKRTHPLITSISLFQKGSLFSNQWGKSLFFAKACPKGISIKSRGDDLNESGF